MVIVLCQGKNNIKAQAHLEVQVVILKILDKRSGLSHLGLESLGIHKGDTATKASIQLFFPTGTGSVQVAISEFSKKLMNSWRIMQKIGSVVIQNCNVNANIDFSSMVIG